MCGIWGWWQRDGRSALDDAMIRSATDVMRSRGPDDFGSYRSESGLAMGFRRLSIDLEGGYQPMSFGVSDQMLAKVDITSMARSGRMDAIAIWTLYALAQWNQRGRSSVSASQPQQ